VRTTARWYHKILENMRIDDKNEHVTRARWVDLDGEPGLRTVCRAEYPLAFIDWDAGHFSHGFYTWLRGD